MNERRPGSTGQAEAGLEFALGTIARPNLLVLAWRWRWELALTAGLATAIAAAAAAIGLAWTITAAAGLTAGVLAVPETRRLVIAHAWCVITPHRIRSGCAQAWIHTRTGRLPFILFTTCEPFGERVRIWCRAGLSADDFAAARPRLAASCWARDVQVTRSDRYAHLITLDVIRRDRRGRPFEPARATWQDTADLRLTADPLLAEHLSGEPADQESGDWPSDLDQADGADEPATWAAR